MRDESYVWQGGAMKLYVRRKLYTLFQHLEGDMLGARTAVFLHPAPLIATTEVTGDVDSSLPARFPLQTTQVTGGKLATTVTMNPDVLALHQTDWYLLPVKEGAVYHIHVKEGA